MVADPLFVVACCCLLVICCWLVCFSSCLLGVFCGQVEQETAQEAGSSQRPGWRLVILAGAPIHLYVAK